MQIYEKELSDTDSIYCVKPTNSHQSSIFIGPTGSSELCALFGFDYASDMDLVIELSKDNLLLNVLYHYLDSVKYKKRGTSMDWELDKNWLLEKQLTIGRVFKGAHGRFHVSVNKETTRTYLKGITSIMPEGGMEKLDLRNYLFSGDILKMWRKPDNSVVVVVSDRGGEVMGEWSKNPIQESLDCLSSALKLFRRGRAEKGLDGWASFDAWAKEARTQFAKADAAMLTEADFDYAGFMRKFVYNPTVANNSFKNHTAAEKAAVGDFISNNRQSPHAVSWYLDSANRPAAAGMGVGVMFNFMMKVRPAEFATYSSMLDKMLVFTGVAKEPSPNEITVESYEA